MSEQQLEAEIADLQKKINEKAKELKELRNQGTVASVELKSGPVDMYRFVDYIKSRKYRVPKGETITLKGIGGGLVDFRSEA